MKTTTSSFKRIVAATGLALALLVAQHAAVLHWLGHSVAAAQTKPDAGGGLPAVDHCDACLAFSALGAGATAAEFTAAPIPAVRTVAISADSAARPTACRFAFRSRAPPYS